MTARLNDHVARETEIVAQREQHLGSSVFRMIFSLSAEREICLGAKDVDVCVDRPCRRQEARLGGMVGPGLCLRHANTTPSMSLRAVRSIPASMGLPLSSTVTTHSVIPVGCSTPMVL